MCSSDLRRREWRESDGGWVADVAGPVEADAARDAIISRRVQRDLGTPCVLVARWDAPSEATLSAWVGGLSADPFSWESALVEEG